MADESEQIKVELQDDITIKEAEESPEEEESTYGCSHYKRKCQLVCPDCSKVYSCRFCHDDEVSSHTFNRYAVKEVICLVCQERQPSGSNACRSCFTVFGKYFCAICNLYNDEDRQQYHCIGCGLCRVGPRDHFFHCQRCDMCFPVKLEGNHRCIEQASRCPCAVCYEDIHTARTASHIPPCGHLIHQPCFENLIQKAHYTCPVCNASMIDMRQIWTFLDGEIEKSPMPEEYAMCCVSILCRDCHKFSTVKMHFIGQKCGHCGGYNTCVEKRHPAPLEVVTPANNDTPTTTVEESQVQEQVSSAESDPDVPTSS